MQRSGSSQHRARLAPRLSSWTSVDHRSQLTGVRFWPWHSLSRWRTVVRTWLRVGIDARRFFDIGLMLFIGRSCLGSRVQVGVLRVLLSTVPRVVHVARVTLCGWWCAGSGGCCRSGIVCNRSVGWLGLVRTSGRTGREHTSLVWFFCVDGRGESDQITMHTVTDHPQNCGDSESRHHTLKPAHPC